MMKILSIFTIGILLLSVSPIKELKIDKPPTKLEAKKLNHSDNEFEIFLSDEGKVEYRDYDYRRVKGAALPFKIKGDLNSEYNFGGRQVNLKIKDGWLVGFDKGEWGGNLFWFNENGTEYERITRGNIKNLFEIDGQIYVTEGLAHLSISQGQIFKVERKNRGWNVEKQVDLPNAPYATTLTDNSEFLIVTSKGLLKVNKGFEVETLVEEGFWWAYLYPNSILLTDCTIYIGMRGGILRTQIDQIDDQEWLTK